MPTMPPNLQLAGTVTFVSPTIGSNEAPMREAPAKHMDMYVASMRDKLRTALWEAQAQTTAEAC